MVNLCHSRASGNLDLNISLDPGLCWDDIKRRNYKNRSYGETQCLKDVVDRWFIC